MLKRLHNVNQTTERIKLPFHNSVLGNLLAVGRVKQWQVIPARVPAVFKQVRTGFKDPNFPLLLLSRFSSVQLCATSETAAHQAPPSLGFSRPEHWSGLPFPSPMHESEKWKWSRSVVSDPQRPHGLQPTRLLRPWDLPGKSTGVGCHCPPVTLKKNLRARFRLVANNKRVPDTGNGNLLQYSCLENPRHRGPWRATVRGVAESDTTERSLVRPDTRVAHLYPFLTVVFLSLYLQNPLRNF